MSYEKYVQKIEEIERIQESLEDLKPDFTESDLDNIYESIPKKYFNSKNKFDKLLQVIISILFSGSIRERQVLLLLSKMKEEISRFYKDDQIYLIKTAKPYVFINEWLYEENILTIPVILSESESDVRLSQYFLPEIIENDESLYKTLLRKFKGQYIKLYYLNVPEKNHYDTTFSKEELNEIKNRRKKQIEVRFGTERDYDTLNLYDPSPIRCAIMSDDIDKFQEIISQNNISVDSFCPPSIYDQSYFPSRYLYDENERSLIEAAALFGSEKIFKFLLLKDAQIRPEEIFRRVLFGRNLNIFHMTEEYILRDATYMKMSKAVLNSLRTELTKSYIDLYMKCNGDDPDEDQKEGKSEEENGEEKSSTNDKEKVSKNDEKSSTNDKEKNSDDEEKNSANDEEKNSDDEGKNSDDDEEKNYDDDDSVWVLDNSPRSDKIRKFFYHCIEFAIKYSQDYIVDYLYENYNYAIGFTINTDFIASRLVNYGFRDFRERYLPIYVNHINEVDEYKNTFLMNACFFNYTDLVKLFLRIPGVDVNYMSSKGLNAMCLAIEQHSFKSAEILLKCPLFIYDFSALITPFLNAARWGYIDEMNLLIQTKKKFGQQRRFKKLLCDTEISITLINAIEANKIEPLKVILNNFNIDEFSKEAPIHNFYITMAAQSNITFSWFINFLNEKKSKEKDNFSSDLQLFLDKYT